jgi:hypothetical protein
MSPVNRRALIAIAVAVVALISFSGATRVDAASPPDSTGGESVVTLANGRDVSECVSALPKPDCTTSRRADAMQITVLLVMAAGMGVIGWRIAHAIRQRDRVGATSPATSTAATDTTDTNP